MSDKRAIQPNPASKISFPGRSSRLVSRGLQRLDQPRRRLTILDRSQQLCLIEEINNHGQIVGTRWVDQNARATLWHNGQVVDIGTHGDRLSGATGINDRGQIVGDSHTAMGNHAFFWDSGHIQDIHPIGRYWNVSRSDISQYDWSTAAAVNNIGQVVGTIGLPQGAVPFLWQDNQLEILKIADELNLSANLKLRESQAEPEVLPVRVNAAAVDINDRGQIVGTLEVQYAIDRLQSWCYFGFIWENGGTTLLDIFPTAINNSGQITGDRHSWPIQAENIEFPFLGILTGASSSQSVEVLRFEDEWRLLDPRYPGKGIVRPSGINNRGQVVGWVEPAPFRPESEADRENWDYKIEEGLYGIGIIPFLWDQGQMQRLVSSDVTEEAGIEFEQATLAINDNGQVAATVVDERGFSYPIICE